MAVVIKGGTLNDCEIGISAPHSADMTVSGVMINRSKKAIELRDPPSMIEILGLPSNTPLPLVIDALNILKQSESAPQDKQIDVFKTTELFSWLSVERVANLSTIIGTFLQFLPAILK